MTTQESSNGEAPPEASEQKPDVDQIKAEIEQTRAELGETVDLLTAKMDVKSRAKATLNQTKDRAGARLASARDAATDADGKPTPPVLIGVGSTVAVVVALTVLLVWRRRR